MPTPLIPKYHCAPNLSINPIECGGMLELGSIIPNIAQADEPPLNEDCHIKIPQAKMFCSHQKGFTLTQGQMISGTYGVVAKVLGIEGIGGELSWASGRSTEDVYTITSLDTIYFQPSPSYLKESMAKSEVAEYINGTGGRPVFMVTGLKTARGPAVRMNQSTKKDIIAELGVNLTAGTGVPLELGPRNVTSREKRQELGFEESTDFIIGIKVKKLMYKKHWLLRTRVSDEVDVTEYNKGATLADGDRVVKKAEEKDVVDLGVMRSRRVVMVKSNR